MKVSGNYQIILSSALAITVALTLSGCVMLLPLIDEDGTSAESASVTETLGEACRENRVTRAQFGNRAKLVHAIDPRNRRGMASVEILREKLKSANAAQRTRAASDLGSLGTRAVPAIPALIDALNDESKHVRRAAAKSLGKIGPRAREAVPELTKRLNDSDPFIPATVQAALRKIGS